MTFLATQVTTVESNASTVRTLLVSERVTTRSVKVRNLTLVVTRYFPLLKRWVGGNADVTLQWHHLPLAAHEPAASAEARLAECVGEAGGHAAFWQAVEWVYAHTRSDGQGLPEGQRYPDLTPAIEQCLASERPDAPIRTQTAEATNSGVTATPSLRLRDRQTGKAILLQGPIEGDALLSAMDMLAADDPATPTSKSEMPADVVGDMPR